MEGEPISVGRTVDLDEDGHLVTKLPDGKEVLVFRVAGVLYAVQRRCPHEAAPLFLCILPGEQED